MPEEFDRPEVYVATIAGHKRQRAATDALDAAARLETVKPEDAFG